MGLCTGGADGDRTRSWMKICLSKATTGRDAGSERTLYETIVDCVLAKVNIATWQLGSRQALQMNSAATIKVSGLGSATIHRGEAG